MKKLSTALIIFGLFVHLSMLLSLALHFELLSFWPPKIKPELTISRLQDNLKPVDVPPGAPPNVPQSLYQTRRARGLHLWDKFFWDSSIYEVGFDFFGLYKGALDLMRGRSIYEVARYTESDTVFDDEIVPYYCPFIYPPIVAYLMVPLALLLSPWKAYVFWCLLQECLLALCIFVSRRFFDRDIDKSIATTMWLAFTPFYLLLYIGQTSFVIATCILLLAYWHKSGKKTAADWAWIASVALKLLTLIAAPALVRFKRYRAVVLAVAVVILASIPYFAFKPDDAPFFAHLVESRTIAPYGGDFSHSEVSWLLFGPESSPIASKVFMWSVILLSLGLTFVPKNIQFVDCLSLWICTYFLAYIRIWEHHYVMIAPVLILLYFSTRSWFVLAIFVPLAMPTPLVLFAGSWTHLETLVYHLFKLVPVAMLYAFVVKTIISRRRCEATTRSLAGRDSVAAPMEASGTE